ncbi:MAG: hypothetical protein AAFV62_11610 [Pseudomonadota bacterium]
MITKTVMARHRLPIAATAVGLVVAVLLATAPMRGGSNAPIAAAQAQTAETAEQAQIIADLTARIEALEAANTGGGTGGLDENRVALQINNLQTATARNFSRLNAVRDGLAAPGQLDRIEARLSLAERAVVRNLGRIRAAASAPAAAPPAGGDVATRLSNVEKAVLQNYRRTQNNTAPAADTSALERALSDLENKVDILNLAVPRLHQRMASLGSEEDRLDALEADLRRLANDLDGVKAAADGVAAEVAETKRLSDETVAMMEQLSSVRSTLDTILDTVSRDDN